MARAHTIWIVVDQHKEVKAAFTVKHECVSWLEKAWNSLLGDWRVIGVKDNDSTSSRYVEYCLVQDLVDFLEENDD